MKYTLALFAAVVLGFYLIASATWLLNQPDDAAVVSGWLVIICAVYGYVVAVKAVRNKVMKGRQ